jgi:alpha-glucosidase
LLAFRRAHPAFAKGEIDFLATSGDAVAFTRRGGNEAIVCAFNLGSAPAVIDLGDRSIQPLSGHGFSGQAGDGKVRLEGYGAWFGRIA